MTDQSKLRKDRENWLVLNSQAIIDIFGKVLIIFSFFFMIKSKTFFTNVRAMMGTEKHYGDLWSKRNLLKDKRNHHQLRLMKYMYDFSL